MDAEFEENYGIFTKKSLTKKKKEKLNDVKLKILMDPPKKETGLQAPVFQKPAANVAHQVDLLFLPTDKDGSKYCLTVVDIGTRMVDAEPLKDKKQTTINAALKRVYSRGILEMPSRRITADAGSEFNALQKALPADVSIKRAQTSRHRQLGIVESFNKILGKAIFIGQYNRELKTGKIDTNWVADLPKIIKLVNARTKEKNETVKPDEARLPSAPPTYLPPKILSPGTKVHRILDAPLSLQGDKLFGNFRATDLRFNPKTDEIERIVLRGGQPLMYKLKDVDGTLYTEGQLRPIKK